MMGTDFRAAVEAAMGDINLSNMRPVVEKEILHYEIFQALDAAGLLKDIVFQGGTSLRLCYGSSRFSEDLDFAGGENLSDETMAKFKACIEDRVGARFGLEVRVKEPVVKPGEETGVTVRKWSIVVKTHPENVALPQQRIKIEVASIPAHTSTLAPLTYNYAHLVGMAPLMVRVETRKEILADKLVALPCSATDGEGAPVTVEGPSRVRHRDLWDIAFLAAQGVTADPEVLELVTKKVADYGIQDYGQKVDTLIDLLPGLVRSKQFAAQMSRFIAADRRQSTFENPAYLDFMARTLGDAFAAVQKAVADTNVSAPSDPHSGRGAVAHAPNATASRKKGLRP